MQGTWKYQHQSQIRNGSSPLTQKGEDLIQTSKLAERDEFCVSRWGGAKDNHSSIQGRAASTGLATTLIESSRVQNARKPGQSIRCTVHYPFECSGRAMETKGSQLAAFRAGMHSQIYFEGTETCPKVEERERRTPDRR